MGGRHRKRRHGLPPVLSGAAIAAVLVGTIAMVQPDEPPAQILLPAPTPARATPPPTSTPASPTTTPVPTTLQLPTVVPLPTTTRPSPTTSRPPEPEPEPPPPPPPEACSTAPLLGTRGHVAAAGRHLANRYGIPTTALGGLAARANPTSDHPRGYALDFMVDRETGDQLAAYALDHQDELSVKYVIWRQRISHGRGWGVMEDRGSTTANHYDHVHLSFRDDPPTQPITC